jgi:hypothetical protein
MRRYFVLFLIICLVATPFCRRVSAETMEWQDKVLIRDETTITEKDQIKVKPGTKISFSGIKAKLNIRGQFSVQGNEKNPVTISIPNPLYQARPISFQEQTIIKTNQNLKELEIHPYRVETEEIVDELAAFRKQYAFVWVVLMGIQIYLVLNSSTYW